MKVTRIMHQQDCGSIVQFEQDEQMCNAGESGVQIRSLRYQVGGAGDGGSSQNAAGGTDSRSGVMSERPTERPTHPSVSST